MTQAFATVNGYRASEVRVHVPPTGPWFAEVDFEEAPEVSGQVTIQLGDLALRGTVDPGHNGVFGLRRRCRVVAGAGGWATLLPAKAYHNDAGVKALLVAQDAARLAGETLGGFSPGAQKVGNYYTRRAGAASRALEDAAGGSSWWVDYDGITQVGARSSSTPALDAYEVLEVVADDRLVTLAVDDLRTVGIGAVLSKRLEEAMTVRELEIVVTAEGVRVNAWCGGEEGSRGRLEGLLRAIVGQVLGERLLGSYRYRLVKMAGDNERLELQAVNPAAGLPDVLPVPMWPGVAGAHATPALGTEVLVQFVEGDPAQPVVTGFAGKAGPGYTPTSLVLDVLTELKLGAAATQPVALKSDLQTLYAAINGATPTAGDGGAAFKAAIITALNSALFPVCASKVKAL